MRRQVAVKHELRRLTTGLAVALIPLMALGLLLGSLEGKVHYRSRDVPSRGDAIEQVIRQIETQKPEVIIIGSSVVGQGVSALVFQENSGLRALVMSNPGAASAKWYLMIKNIVLATPHRPRAVVLVFRDDLLTRPSYRVTGLYRDGIERYARPEEPLIDRLAYGQTPGYFQQAFSRLERSRRFVKTAGERFARGLIPAVGAKELRKIVNSTFDELGKVDSLINYARRNAEDLDWGQLGHFETGVQASFLPAIVEQAQNADLQLILVRYKRARDVGGNREPPELKGYMRELRSWLAEHRIPLVDFTDDPRITLEHWGQGDHLSATIGKPYFSRLLAEAVAPLVK